jgi:ABC-2 type transport system ATP-binding protein
VLQIEVADRNRLEEARDVLTRMAPPEGIHVDPTTRSVSIPVGTDTALAANAISILASTGIEIEDFTLERPSLDDVFLELTGHSPAADTTDTEAAR